MADDQKWLSLRVFIDEQAHAGGKPLFEAIVFAAREKALMGATVWRSPMGFGHHSRIHNASLLRLSDNLPMMVEIIDREDKIRAFLPDLKAMVGEGMITLHPLEVFIMRDCPGGAS